MYPDILRGIMSEEIEHLDEERISEIIWRNIGLKSVRDIAEMTGLKPEEVLRRKNELLDSVDVLTVQQKRQRLLIELDGMARESRERAQRASDEFFAGTINASTGAIKTYLQELARMEKADSGKIEALNNLRIRELLRLIDVTVARAVTEIAATHNLEEVELMEVFQGHLVEAARELEVE